jgi:hypothetical protein
MRWVGFWLAFWESLSVFRRETWDLSLFRFLCMITYLCLDVLSLNTIESIVLLFLT